MVDGSTQLSLTMLEASPLPLALLHGWGGGEGEAEVHPLLSEESETPCIQSLQG